MPEEKLDVNSAPETMALDANVLVTSRLSLRPLQPMDAEALFEIASTPGPLEMMGETHPEDLSGAKVLLDRFQSLSLYAVIQNEDGRLVGVAGLTDATIDGYDRFRGKKLMVFLGMAYWGRGYMTELANALADYAFNEMKLDMVYAEAGDFNRAAIKSLANAGFFFLDSVKDEVHKDIIEANMLWRLARFNPAPSNNELLDPKPIEVPDIRDDVQVELVMEKERLSSSEEASEIDDSFPIYVVTEADLAKETAKEEGRREEERRRNEEKAREVRAEDARQSAQAMVDEKYPKEERAMPEMEPITIEVNEDETVEMEINGVRTVLYQGQKKAPKKAKPASAPVAKPEPAPAPTPEPKRPLIPQRRSNKRLKPTRKLASFGPGTTDDGQHSIHTVSFEDKLSSSPKAIRDKYKALSKYLSEVYGCNHRISFGYDSYRVGKKVAVALSVGGVHLRVNTCLDPKMYAGTKMHVNDDSVSKQYKDLPSRLSIISDKNFKQAYRLIDDTMKSLGVKKNKPE